MSIDSLNLEELQKILQSNNINTRYLAKSLHFIVNDYQENLDANTLLNKLNNSQNLVCNKYCLLESKSNLLRFMLNTEDYNKEIKVINYLNQLIQQQEDKAIQQLKLNTKSSFMFIKQPNRITATTSTSTVSNKTSDKQSKISFEIKPKYFHSDIHQRNSETKENICKLLKIKDKEMERLKRLQSQNDDCDRYRKWSIHQQEFNQEQRQRKFESQRSSREIRYSISTSTSPRNRSQVSLAKTNQIDYNIEIKRIQNEIISLEKKLKSFY